MSVGFFFSVDSNPKKHQIESEVSIKCDQALLGILLINQMTGFLNFQ